MIKYRTMKANIHPQYFDDAKVICVCGNTFNVGSTMQEIHVEICNKCHPFFTGEMKYVDTLGRVEKFQQRQKKAKELKSQIVKKVEEKEEKKRPESLRDMMDIIKKQASS